MKIVHSRNVRSAEAAAKVAALLETVAENQLREWVEHNSVPRHFGAEPAQKRAAAKWITQLPAACVVQQAEDLKNED